MPSGASGCTRLLLVRVVTCRGRGHGGSHRLQCGDCGVEVRTIDRRRGPGRTGGVSRRSRRSLIAAPRRGTAGSLATKPLAHGFHKLRIVADAWALGEPPIRGRFAAHQALTRCAPLLDHMRRRRVGHVSRDDVEEAQGVLRRVIRAEEGLERHTLDSSFQARQSRVRRKGRATARSPPLLLARDLPQLDVSPNQRGVLQLYQRELARRLLMTGWAQERTYLAGSR